MGIKGIIDGCILVIWAVVFAYFVGRYWIYKRLRSLAIAAMALGWAVVGLSDHLIDCPAAVVIAVKIAAITNGIFCWYAIRRVDGDRR